MTEKTIDNPLLQNSGLPDYGSIMPEQIVPGVKEGIRLCREMLNSLSQKSTVSFAELFGSLHQIEALVERFWGPVGHLHAVCDSVEIREAHHEAQKYLVEFQLELDQNVAVFKHAQNIKKGAEWAKLSPMEKRMLQKLLLNMELSGIDLAAKDKEEFLNIVKELSDLRNKFSNNVLDASKAFTLTLDKKEQVDGLAERDLSYMAQLYNEKHQTDKATAEGGPWLLSLDPNLFNAFMTSAKDRSIREQLNKGFVQKASFGETDNTQIMHRILLLRQKEARLLGKKNFAELSLATKMAGTTERIKELMEKVLKPAKEHAKKDLAKITAFAQEQGFEGALMPWDYSYWVERYKEKFFSYNEEALKDYFPLDHTIKGLFDLCHTLFDIKITEEKSGFSKWHQDVRYFKIMDSQNKQLASFFVDPFARPATKRSGAWMNSTLTGHKENDTYIHPVAIIVCNSAAPHGKIPALLTYREVETLFHEFGHALQHMLTKVGYFSMSGINGVEWDAVEVCSQFMENFLSDPQILKSMSCHYETKEPLPDTLIAQILAAKNFNKGFQYTRQLSFGLSDLALHEDFDPEKESAEAIFDLVKNIEKRISVLPLNPYDRRICSFSHIFAGGYCAGYYSYLWAEVLSTDVFYAFKEVGLDKKDMLKEIGKKFYDTFLSLGGGTHPLEVFKLFRGREPSVNPLLEDNGLVV